MSIAAAQETYLNAYRVKGSYDVIREKMPWEAVATVHTADFNKIVCARNIAEVHAILELVFKTAQFEITSCRLIGNNILMETAEAEKHNAQCAF